MKRLILLMISLIGISVAVSAQQDGFFDIQKYMEKKHIERKQHDKLVLNKPVKKNPSTYFLAGKTKQKRLSHLLPNGDKVYLLDQYNMPCVVPDMKKFRQMPNLSDPDNYLNEVALRANTPGRIPNVAYPPSGWGYIPK
ncbi:MAG: hypothetical protein ABIO81_03255 [Ginsengibacter sp.]